MNISRAKTILICAFLGLNLFLCYHLFGGEFEELARVRALGKQWRHVEEKLVENGYILVSGVDHRIRKSTFITVSPLAAPVKTIQEHFSISRISLNDEGALLYKGRKASLKVFPGGLIRLELDPGEIIPIEPAADEAIMATLVERYLRENRLVPAETEVVHEHTFGSGEKTVLCYVQTFKEKFLFSGFLKVILENNILRGMEMYLLEPESSHRGREMEVIPVGRALLKLVEVAGPNSPPRRIVRADLGFYSREYDAEKWEVPPVWRFLLDNGESYYINAFTGNLEP